MITTFEQKIKSIKKERGGHIHPSRICYEIMNDNAIKDYTYIIMGKSGPTGKTWLCNELKSSGFDVVEISESTYDLIGYMDSDDHCRVDDFQKTVTIILNRSLR